MMNSAQDTGLPPGSLLSGALLVLGLAAVPLQGQPANDLFANRLALTGTNVVVLGDNFDATLEAGEPLHAGMTGGASVWWTWTAPTNGTVTISTAGSAFDTLLGVYSGSAVGALTQLASNDDNPAAGDYSSKVVFDVAVGTVCQIAVDGYYGEMGAIQLQVQWTLPQPPPPPPPAPPWTLPDPYGQIVYSSNFAGKVIVLNFWATWCGPCIAEIPDLMALQDKYRGDGLVVVGASVDSTASAVINFLSTTPLNYPVVMADGATTVAYGGIQYIPATFIISRQNLIMKTFVGSQSMSTFEKQVIPLLYRDTRLSARVNGSQYELRWPTNTLAFILESANPLPQPAWSAWPTPPVLNNGSNLVTVPFTTSNRVFRLRMPY